MPAVASSMAALSRTDRLMTCSIANPFHSSPRSGPVGVDPRLGLNPKSPQHDAGMRMEPPPSPPLAKGTKRAAIAAAEPPLDPPGECAADQGLRVGPKASGSVYGVRPNSGVLVRPRMDKPA